MSKMTAARRLVAALGTDGKSRVVLEERLPLDGEPERIRLTNLWIAPLTRADNRASFDGGFLPFAMSQT